MDKLHELAERNGVIVEQWPLTPPMKGAYIAQPGCPPVIAISSSIAEGSPEYRTVLAHELGHHFTGSGDVMPRPMYSYGETLTVNRAEYRANRWAADYLLPWDKLSEAIRNGVAECWQIAEYFRVTESLARFRFSQL